MAGKSKANGAKQFSPGWGGSRQKGFGRVAELREPLPTKLPFYREAARIPVHPVQFMLEQLANEVHPLSVRLEIARSVAPYVAPRLNSIETVKPLRSMTAEELRQFLREIDQPQFDGLRVIEGGLDG
jgi:hypothetical protein